MTITAAPPYSTQPPRYGSAARIVTAVFFMLGFITCLNDILIPHLRVSFDLNYAQAMLVQMTFFGTYLFVSLPAGRIVLRFGYQKALVVGLLICALGAVLFYPAASRQSYPVFLAALFVLATGITIQQVAFNPYMSLLGPPETASSRMSLAHAFNSLGTTVAPLFGGMLILSSHLADDAALTTMGAAELAAYRAAEAHAVQLPYMGIAAVLVLVALVVGLWRMPDFTRHARESGATQGVLRPLMFRHMRLAVLGIFFYVGAEVAIGSFMINYLSAPDIGGISHSRAAFYLSLYWGGAMVGRFVGALLLRVIPTGKLLGCFAMIAALLVATSLSSTGAIAMWSIVAVGLFNSIMFPSIFSLGIVGLRDLTPQASSLISMAIVGGAVMPMIQGLLADRIGLQPAFIVPIFCYVYIAFYGWVGSRPQES